MADPSRRIVPVAVWAVLAAALIGLIVFVIMPLAARGRLSKEPTATRPAEVMTAPAADEQSSQVPGQPADVQVALTKVYAVEGMHCQACANRIKQQLEAMPGVVSANVSFEEKKAYVSVTPDHSPSDAQVEQVVVDAGYKAMPLNQGS